MKITKIEKQQKYKNRYNIYLDNEFWYGLYDDTILKFGLRTNDILNEKKLEEIREYDQFNHGKKIAYTYLSYKPRSKKELINKLKEKKIPGNIIEDLTKLLEEQKYLNDKTYAKNFLENKLHRKPLGKRLLQMKLTEKGIDKETTEETINEFYSEEKEIILAGELLKKYEKKIKYKNNFDKKQKCYQYLISRGFEYEIANKVLNNLS